MGRKKIVPPPGGQGEEMGTGICINLNYAFPFAFVRGAKDMRHPPREERERERERQREREGGRVAIFQAKFIGIYGNAEN